MNFKNIKIKYILFASLFVMVIVLFFNLKTCTLSPVFLETRLTHVAWCNINKFSIPVDRQAMNEPFIDNYYELGIDGRYYYIVLKIKPEFIKPILSRDAWGLKWGNKINPYSTGFNLPKKYDFKGEAWYRNRTDLENIYTLIDENYKNSPERDGRYRIAILDLATNELIVVVSNLK